MQDFDDLIRSFIEIELKNDGDFLKVKETLTRIGIANMQSKTLWQSCHILHKKGKLYIVHFKELFALDGKRNEFDENDLARRNSIANLLQDWGLLSIKNPDVCVEPRAPLYHIKIIPYKEKPNWKLEAKHSLGSR